MGCKTKPPGPSAAVVDRIAAARAGDEQALEDIIRHYQDRVARYVAALVGRNCGDLDDLCQVIFLKMALSLRGLRSAGAFEPWLFKIARNACRDHLRRLRVRSLFVPLSRDHEAIAADQTCEEPATRSGTVERALMKLSRAQRDLIELMRGCEYSYDELARHTRSSRRAVAGRLFRARARLRKLLRYNGTDR